MQSLQWSWIAKKAEESKNAPASSDVELVKRLKQRDERAFLSLYDRHRSSVYRYLLFTTGSVTAAEELTQEVFVVILDAMCAGTVGQFNPKKGTWEGYLLGIARNLARAERRRTNHVVSLDSILEMPDWNLIVQGFSTDVQVGHLETLLGLRSELRALSIVILELPDHYREVLVLCGLQERSYREAAAILQCSEGTVASRINRAKAILADRLRNSARTE